MDKIRKFICFFYVDFLLLISVYLSQKCYTKIGNIVFLGWSSLVVSMIALIVCVFKVFCQKKITINDVYVLATVLISSLAWLYFFGCRIFFNLLIGPWFLKIIICILGLILFVLWIIRFVFLFNEKRGRTNQGTVL